MEKKERKTLRVAVYCRFACAEEKQTLSKAQREKFRVYVKEQGYKG